MSSILRLIYKAVILSLFFLTTSLMSDQNDPQLDLLFDRLQATQDSNEAQIIIQKIWFVWYQHENQEIEYLMEQGEVSMRRSDYEQAIGIYSRVISIDPEFAEGWNRRATIYYLMEEYDLSTQDVEKTLTLEPRHFGALSGQGLIYLKQEKPKLAVKLFKQALKVNPHMLNIRRNLEALEENIGDVI